MRILIASQIYGPSANGQAVFTSQLARGLAARGHRVVAAVPAFGSEPRRWLDDGVEVHRLRSLDLGEGLRDAFLPLLPRLQLRSVFEKLQPEIIHLQDHYPLSRAVYAMARARGVPVVATNHFLPDNIIHYVWPFRRGRRFAETALWWSMTSLYRRVDAVTTPTSTAAEILEPHLAGGPSIHPISCGVDLDRFASGNGWRRDEIRERFQLPTNVPVIAYVGRIDKEKQLEVLLQGFRQAGGQVHLALVGVGRWENEIRALIQELDLNERATMTGFVETEILPELLAAVDIFVMPSPAELQSIATLEAMAAGKPILAARARALPELVENGTNGFLFEPGDSEALALKLNRLLSNRDRRERMGQASRVRVALHSVSYAVNRYYHLYCQLAQASFPALAALPGEETLSLEP